MAYLAVLTASQTSRGMALHSNQTKSENSTNLVGNVTETNCTQAPKPTNGRELEKPYRDLVKAGRMERKNEKNET